MMGEMRQWRVTPQEAGMRLLAFLREKKGQPSSVKALKRAIDGKCCTVNGQTKTLSSHCLRSEDLVTLNSFDTAPITRVGVLYEDEDLLVIDKPSGLISEERYLAPLLPTRAELIHRLDKETSGVLLLSKNKEIQEAMIALFRKREIRKSYLALVDGSVTEPQGKIVTSLKKRSRHGQVFYEVGVRKGPRDEAITLWKCLKKRAQASLLHCELITGRTHQLRVHLNWLGYPILGDTHYGEHFRCRLAPQRHLLHAHILCFTHPRTGKRITITAPLPEDFIAAEKKLFPDSAK